MECGRGLSSLVPNECIITLSASVNSFGSIVGHVVGVMVVLFACLLL